MIRISFYLIAVIMFALYVAIYETLNIQMNTVVMFALCVTIYETLNIQMNTV